MLPLKTFPGYLHLEPEHIRLISTHQKVKVLNRLSLSVAIVLSELVFISPLLKSHTYNNLKRKMNQICPTEAI